jgi:pimeloyl-ACP methyl ester carboxylesterase
VSENRARPDSRLIALPILRVRATIEHPAEPIFWLNGGPGMSNLGFTPPAALLANHDVVMVGYRGVDGSVVLACPEVREAFTGVGDDLLSVESRANLGAATAHCAQRLQADGVDLAQYTIPDVVADLEAARTALGYARINLLSQSYGTRIAQIYAASHPDRLHRSAMIGVNPPGHFVWEPATIDAQLSYYARLCEQDVACRARGTDLATTMRNIAHSMPKRWLFIPIDPGKVKTASFALLFNRGTAAMVFDAYQAAAAGDASGLALLSLVSDLALPSLVVWGDFFAKGGTADYDPARAYAAELNPRDAILGSPLSLLIFDSLPGNWPLQDISTELQHVQASDVETLLISGSVDFSTPAEFATTELLPQLTRGQQVILREMGHVDDIWKLQPVATERLLTSFYATGVADASLYRYAPMDFRVSLGFPALAKLLLGLLVLLIALLMAFVWFIVRRVRRRLTVVLP